jgi:hypothetical protein
MARRIGEAWPGFSSGRCLCQRRYCVELTAETIALSWQWYVRLARRGKDAARFVTALASFAARAAHSGRRLCGQERSRDALSPRARQRHGYTVSPLPDGSGLGDSAFDEALVDNRQTPVPEQAAFRCDFPAWQKTRTDRDRRLIGGLMLGERTLDVARRYGLSPARISQLRREFHTDWLAFCGDLPVPGAPAVRKSGSPPACAC